MKFALAQLNYTVGNFPEIKAKQLAAYKKAQAQNVDLLIFSELSTCGYTPRDLLERPQFIRDIKKTIDEIAGWTKDSKTSLLIGAPIYNSKPKNKYLYNSALLLQNGKIHSQVSKKLLCTYDVFDESRYFEPGSVGETSFLIGFQPLQLQNSSFISAKNGENLKPNELGEVINFNNQHLGISICEDIWNDIPVDKSIVYPSNPIHQQVSTGCDVLINVSASPWYQGKERLRFDMISGIAKKYQLPILYCNQVGANDELVFDGHSMIFDAQGSLVKLGKAFEEDFLTVEFDDIKQNSRNVGKLAGAEKIVAADSIPEICPIPANEEEFSLELLHKALITGTADYLHKCGFSKVVLGLSGGIDSTLVAVLAAQALGVENVTCIGMPTRFSSAGSIADSQKFAQNLGVKYEIIDIDKIFQQYLETDSSIFNPKDINLTVENVQPRIRSNILMGYANKHNSLVLVTSNKSEIAVGYSTIYGDMAGALAIIGDLYKTVVYKLCRFINKSSEIIPNEVITKPPSAELKPNQTDQDSLPDYDVLDQILMLFLEKHLETAEIARITGFNSEIIGKVVKLVYISEYKRKQAAPILKVTTKSFGLGRRYPIAAKYTPDE